MRIDCIVPHIDDRVITIIGRLERGDWEYPPTCNTFETLKSENIYISYLVHLGLLDIIQKAAVQLEVFPFKLILIVL